MLIHPSFSLLQACGELAIFADLDLQVPLVPMLFGANFAFMRRTLVVQRTGQVALFSLECYHMKLRRRREIAARG